MAVPPALSLGSPLADYDANGSTEISHQGNVVDIAELRSSPGC
ncbi:MAG: hypothetical protein OJF48_002170 [Afipia sp.]|nr:MAG: hypothetical protein OJF48_002170 [Afipia sp.]